jgi:hypothetical protein
VYNRATSVGSVPNARLIGEIKTENEIETAMHSRATVVGGAPEQAPEGEGKGR